ncbi:hypothetical protein [Flavobacterium sp.]|uniref:hypothetical protein n=1 Tax=Flavobacterium sp. TaxID=239 RepID=UPI0040470981
MAGEGSMLHAIKSLAYNKSLRSRNNRVTWKDYKIQDLTPGNDPITSTPEQLEAIRFRIQTENKKRKKYQIILALLSIIVAILVIYLITKINYVGIQMNSAL